MDVIAWIPYGRKRTVSILIEYLRREVERGVLSEVWLYRNMDDDQEDDALYARALDVLHDWVRLVDIPDETPRTVRNRRGKEVALPKQRRTIGAYSYMTDPTTVYVRFDDDIVWVHPDAVETLADKATSGPQLLTSALIWNNAICTWWLQACGKVPAEWGDVTRYCMDNHGWRDGDFAVKMHRLLLDHIDADTTEELYTYQDLSLNPTGEQFSVSCWASTGKKLAEMGAQAHTEEERHLTVTAPNQTGIPNLVAGDALVSHYTFFPQQEKVNATDILDRYRTIARQQT